MTSLTNELKLTAEIAATAYDGFTKLNDAARKLLIDAADEIDRLEIELEGAMRRDHESGEDANRLAARVERMIPRLENCGRYLAQDNKGQWHYINHANTWQGFQGPSFAPSVSDEQPKAEDAKRLSPQGASAVGVAETPALSTPPCGQPQSGEPSEGEGN